MSYSLPIVATDVGDNHRLIENDINGYLTKVKDYKAIANRLFDLISTYDKRVNFGRNSYLKLKANYSFNSFQNKYIRLIEELEK